MRYQAHTIIIRACVTHKILTGADETGADVSDGALGLADGMAEGDADGELLGLAEGDLVGEEVGDGAVTGTAGEVNMNVELLSVRFLFVAFRLSSIVSVNSVTFNGVIVTAKVTLDVSRRSSSGIPPPVCSLRRAPQG